MNKTVIITGGTKGIGKDLCVGFLQEGYNVVVGARSKSNIETLNPQKVKYVQCDLRDEASHKILADVAVSTFNSVDVYINNVGLSSWRPLREINDEFFNEMISVNLKSVFFGCKIASTILANGGSIINISSLAGKRGTSNNSMYVAAKFGVNGMTQALAKELGSSGIRINALCPVLIKTPGLIEAIEKDYAPAVQGIDLYLSSFVERESPLGSLPTGRDVANMAIFLASSKAAAITGQCINVDCGVLPG